MLLLLYGFLRNGETSNALTNAAAMIREICCRHESGLQDRLDARGDCASTARLQHELAVEADLGLPMERRRAVRIA